MKHPVTSPFPGVASLLLLSFACAAQAQIHVGQEPGSRFSYTYNPLEAGVPPETIEEPAGHLPLSYANEGSAAFLFSRTEAPASATWHFQLTDPQAIWGNDAWIRGGVLLIDMALADKESNYWLYEYSTDGVTFFPFFSTRESDAGQPYHWTFGGAHSGSGAMSLSRGGYKGGGRDLYIRLSAVNLSEQGVWMQALRVDGDANREFKLEASIMAADQAEAMPEVQVQTATSLNQSASDAINGNIGSVSQPLFLGASPAGFTDASSATEPGGNVLWQPDNAAHHVTWDLGSEGAAERRLDRVSIWLSADDPGRTNYHGGLSVSMDGSTFVDVPGGHFANRLPHAGGSYNHVEHAFPPGQVVGFRYLRLTSYGLAANGDVYWQPRIAEVDVFVSAAPAAGYANWRSEHFSEAELSDETVSGPKADPDADGLPNLVEYALGLNPKLADAASWGASGVNSFEGESYLSLAFRRPDNISDIEYVVEVSNGLTGWTADAVLVEEASNGDGTSTLLYRDPVPTGGSSRRFMRLRVTSLN